MYRAVEGEYRSAIETTRKVLTAEFGEAIAIPSERPHTTILNASTIAQSMIGHPNEACSDYRREVRSNALNALKPELYPEPITERLAEVGVNDCEDWIVLRFVLDQNSILNSENILANRALQAADSSFNFVIEKPTVGIAKIIRQSRMQDVLDLVQESIKYQTTSKSVEFRAPVSNIARKKHVRTK